MNDLNLNAGLIITYDEAEEPSHDNKFDTHSHDYNVGANIVWRIIHLSWRAPSDN